MGKQTGAPGSRFGGIKRTTLRKVASILVVGAVPLAVSGIASATASDPWAPMSYPVFTYVVVDPTAGVAGESQSPTTSGMSFTTFAVTPATPVVFTQGAVNERQINGAVSSNQGFSLTVKAASHKRRHWPVTLRNYIHY